MFSNLSKYLAPLVILGFAATASAQVYTDDFNRPDSSSMGADWAEDNGDFEIQSGRAVGVGSLGMTSTSSATPSSLGPTTASPFLWM